MGNYIYIIMYRIYYIQSHVCMLYIHMYIKTIYKFMNVHLHTDTHTHVYSILQSSVTFSEYAQTCKVQKIE